MPNEIRPLTGWEHIRNDVAKDTDGGFNMPWLADAMKYAGENKASLAGQLIMSLLAPESIPVQMAAQGAGAGVGKIATNVIDKNPIDTDLASTTIGAALLPAISKGLASPFEEQALQEAGVTKIAGPMSGRIIDADAPMAPLNFDSTPKRLSAFLKENAPGKKASSPRGMTPEEFEYEWSPKNPSNIIERSMRDKSLEEQMAILHDNVDMYSAEGKDVLRKLGLWGDNYKEALDRFMHSKSADMMINDATKTPSQKEDLFNKSNLGDKIREILNKRIQLQTPENQRLLDMWDEIARINGGEVTNPPRETILSNMLGQEGKITPEQLKVQRDHLMHLFRSNPELQTRIQSIAEEVLGSEPNIEPELPFKPIKGRGPGAASPNDPNFLSQGEQMRKIVKRGNLISKGADKIKRQEEASIREKFGPLARDTKENVDRTLASAENLAQVPSGTMGRDTLETYLKDILRNKAKTNPLIGKENSIGKNIGEELKKDGEVDIYQLKTLKAIRQTLEPQVMKAFTHEDALRIKSHLKIIDAIIKDLESRVE